MLVVVTLKRGLCVAVHSHAFPSRLDCSFLRAGCIFVLSGWVTSGVIGVMTSSAGSCLILGSAGPEGVVGVLMI